MSNPTEVEAMESLVHGHLQPDRTVLFDIAPAIAAKRLSLSKKCGIGLNEKVKNFSLLYVMRISIVRSVTHSVFSFLTLIVTPKALRQICSQRR